MDWENAAIGEVVAASCRGEECHHWMFEIFNPETTYEQLAVCSDDFVSPNDDNKQCDIAESHRVPADTPYPVADWGKDISSLKEIYEAAFPAVRCSQLGALSEMGTVQQFCS